MRKKKRRLKANLERRRKAQSEAVTGERPFTKKTRFKEG